MIRPARPKALQLQKNHTPTDFEDIVRRFWPRLSPGEPEIDIGYDDPYGNKRWISFADARSQPVWPDRYIDALQGVKEVIIHPQYVRITFLIAATR